uniref:Gamma-glutamylcyclotransferase n=1 Tax=Anabas testudineus TaxID=64144 RepID=A0A3Q1GYM4_ANATE
WKVVTIPSSGHISQCPRKSLCFLFSCLCFFPHFRGRVSAGSISFNTEGLQSQLNKGGCKQDAPAHSKGNLLKERLQLKNPSATVHCVARLKDYKLVFGNHKGLASDRWHGGVATIEHSPGDEVWGVVWRMNMSDLESLDRQENVTLGAYSPVELSVKTKGQELNCRTYIMNSCVYAPPSPQYLQVIVMGAEQNGLPKDYQEKLRAIKTNMYEGPLPMMAELERARRKAKERANLGSDA